MRSRLHSIDDEAELEAWLRQHLTVGQSDEVDEIVDRFKRLAHDVAVAYNVTLEEALERLRRAGIIER